MGALDDETERLFGRRGKSIPLGPRGRAPRAPGASGRAGTLRRTVHRTPEVIVRITPGNPPTNMQRVRATAAYIARNGASEVEDERGDTYIGEDAVRDAIATWPAVGIPATGGERRAAYHIVTSMPAGTDREAVRAATRAFAEREFGDSRPWLMGMHDDKEHSHGHILVAKRAYSGRALDPRKADLQRWRETFAEALREQGIEANATRRPARGAVRRAQSQAVYHLDRDPVRGPSRVTAAARTEAAREVVTGVSRPNPAKVAVESTRREVMGSYGRIARELARGSADEQRLALDVTRFAASLPPTSATRHGELIEEVRAVRSRGAGDGRETGR